MKIIIDTREQTPLPIAAEVVRKGLYTGDYSVDGLEHIVAIERKSIADLVGSVTSGRDRFEHELHRLRGYHFKRLLVVGDKQDILDGNYRSRATPQSILGSLAAFEVRYEVPVVWGRDEETSARIVENWCKYVHREYVGKPTERIGREERANGRKEESQEEAAQVPSTHSLTSSRLSGLFCFLWQPRKIQNPPLIPIPRKKPAGHPPQIPYPILVSALTTPAAFPLRHRTRLQTVQK